MIGGVKRFFLKKVIKTIGGAVTKVTRDISGAGRKMVNEIGKSGEKIFNDGKEYEGCWWEGKYHGKGLLKIMDGYVLKTEGTWHKGNKHGDFITTFENGNIIKEVHFDGKLKEKSEYSSKMQKK